MSALEVEEYLIKIIAKYMGFKNEKKRTIFQKLCRNVSCPYDCQLLRTLIHQYQVEVDKDALHSACRNRHREWVLPTIQILLDSEKVDVNSLNYHQESALYLVCRRQPDNPELIQYLIERGANVHQRTDVKETPLMVACLQGSTETVQKLIQAGACVNDACGTPPSYPIGFVFDSRNPRPDQIEPIVQILRTAGAELPVNTTFMTKYLQFVEKKSQRLFQLWLTEYLTSELPQLVITRICSYVIDI